MEGIGDQPKQGTRKRVKGKEKEKGSGYQQKNAGQVARKRRKTERRFSIIEFGSKMLTERNFL